MSNPGVRYLAKRRLSNGVEFRVEDNIGEAIHLHYGSEIRLDLSIADFLELDKVCNASLNDLLAHTGFKTQYFDPVFLEMCADILIDLKEVAFDEVMLSELIISTYNVLGIPIMSNLKKSRVTKALNKDYKELDSYVQENMPGQTNRDRVERVWEYMRNCLYPDDSGYIVLFNEQNVIRDGQHRAASLLDIYGDQKIPVIRMKFRDNMYNASMHPFFDWLFRWNRNRIKGLIRKTQQKSLRLVHKVKKICKKLMCRE